MLGLQLCPGCGVEQSVVIVHGLSASSPPDLGCGAAANPAKLMSEGSELIPITRDCGVNENEQDRTRDWFTSCVILKSLRFMFWSIWAAVGSSRRASRSWAFDRHLGGLPERTDFACHTYS